jgi:hypothetical protein
MKNILFVLSVLAMMVVVGCSTPTTDNSVEEETVTTTETTTTTTSGPVEDKSPYEYVLPQGVDYEDYTYVGDYVFSDLYDFENCVWFNGTENSEYGYFMVLKKIARVQYSGSGTPFELYDFDTDTYPLLNKGTSYKIYLKNTYLASNPGTVMNNGIVKILTTQHPSRSKNPDSNSFVIYANDNTYNSFYVTGRVNINDYSPIQ